MWQGYQEMSVVEGGEGTGGTRTSSCLFHGIYYNSRSLRTEVH